MRDSLVKKICSLLLLLPLVLGGCAGNHEDTKISNHFAIFLVKEAKTKDAMQAKLEELILETEPIITDKDIDSYKWKAHELNLIRDFDYNKLSFKVPVDGLPFIVVADDKRIYLGAFWTPVSSLPSTVPVIEVPLRPENVLKIKSGYPGNIKSQPDPRSNENIYNALKSVGKID